MGEITHMIVTWKILTSIPYAIITGVALSMMTEIKKVPLFIVFWEAIGLPVILIDTICPDLLPFKAIFAILVWMLSILLFCGENRKKSVLAGLLVYIVSLVSELTGLGLTLALYGHNASEEYVISDPDEMIAAQLLYWLVLILCCAFLIIVWRKTAHREMESHIEGFLLIPLSQMITIGQTAVLSYIENSDINVYAILVAIAVACVFADAAMLKSIRQYTESMLKAEETAAMEEQLNRQMQYYERKLKEMDNAAKLRHDLRNQIQTVFLLSEKGEYGKAANCVDEMIAFMEQGGEVQ